MSRSNAWNGSFLTIHQEHIIVVAALQKHFPVQFLPSGQDVTAMPGRWLLRTLSCPFHQLNEDIISYHPDKISSHAFYFFAYYLYIHHIYIADKSA